MISFFQTIFRFLIVENIILNWGFGTSLMLRTVRTRKNILPFFGLLTFFSVTTTAICWPLDKLVGREVLAARWIKPVAIVLITSLIYIVTRFLMIKYRPELAKRTAHILQLAAFNNLVIGVTLMIYLREAWPFYQAIAASLGACIGFLLLTWLTAEAIEQMENPDIPKAFKGLPSILVFLGLLALATMAF